MKKKYLALIKEEVEVDEAFRRYLTERKLDILQHFSNLGILTFESEDAISAEDFDCFTLIEEDTTYFTQNEEGEKGIS